MAGDKIRIFLVDDQEEANRFCQLMWSFEPDLELVGSRTTTDGLVEALAATRPSLLVLDLLIPGCDSLAALSEVRARFPSLVVLVASGLDDADIVKEVLRRGASGFFVKSLDLSDLTSLIRRAAGGESLSRSPGATGPKLENGRPA